MIKHVTTYIYLPPGLPSVDRVRELFQWVFEEFRCFKPVHVGGACHDVQMDPDRVDIEALVAYYEEHKTLTITARTERDFMMFSPSKSSEHPHIGWLTLNTSPTEARKKSWREAHLRQVTAVMRLFDSPLAQTGLGESFNSKHWRLVPHPDGFGQEMVLTLRDYSEGLAGLFWRNFLGPPFVRLFGERLASLPEDTRKDLGGGIVLVQPYELPTQAGSPEADERERRLITHLGPECFYDHVHHLKPTRLPALDPGVAR